MVAIDVECAAKMFSVCYVDVLVLKFLTYGTVQRLNLLFVILTLRECLTAKGYSTFINFETDHFAVPPIVSEWS